MFSVICPWTNGWVDNRDPGDLRRHRAHYDITIVLYVNFKMHNCTSRKENHILFWIRWALLWTQILTKNIFQIVTAVTNIFLNDDKSIAISWSNHIIWSRNKLFGFYPALFSQYLVCTVIDIEWAVCSNTEITLDTIPVNTQIGWWSISWHCDL